MFLAPRSRHSTNERYNTFLDNANSVNMSSTFPRIYGIAAIDSKGGLGKNDEIPWHSRELRDKDPLLDQNVKNDMILFRALTNNQICIVGRKTYESIMKYNPKTFNTKRGVYVITNQKLDIPHQHGTFIEVNTMINDRIANVGNVKCIYVIGGAQIYQMYNQLYDAFILSRIYGDYDCDVFLPQVKKNFLIVPRSDDKFFIHYNYGTNKMCPIRPTVSTFKFHQPITQLLAALSPNYITNRCVGQRTRNTYNYSFSVDIRGVLPLCPIRHQDVAMIFHELMWFIRGETDIGILQEKKINIWNANALDAAKRGISTCGKPECINQQPAKITAPQKHSERGTAEPGIDYCGDCVRDIGRTYGAQWRRFGAKSFDQLAYVINLLKNDPYSRRIMLSSWCPPDIFDHACLPPCHVSYNFNVDEERNLYCQVLQRSSDIAVGLSWNIASAGLLTHFLAKTCDLKAHTVSFTLCNAHLYEENEIATMVLYSYNPEIYYASYPKFEMLNKKEIEDYTLDDFVVHNYQPYSEMKFKMVV